MTDIDWRLPENRPSYKAVHLRLRRERGRAREHSCACGKQAEHWAHVRGENEICDDLGRLYSVDLQDYSPMCRSCHYKMDSAGNPRRRAAVLSMLSRVTPESHRKSNAKNRGKRRTDEAKANYRNAWTPERRARQAEVARRVNAERKASK